MEYWDIYDQNEVKTGRTVLRAQALSLKKGVEYHLVVHIWHPCKDGRILVQKRSVKKSLAPGIWAQTGGAVLAGESPIEGAIREVEEELGWSTRPQDYRLIFRTLRETDITYVYATIPEPPVSKFTLDPEEVAAVGYKTQEQIVRMAKEGTFFPYGKAYFDALFEGL